MLTCPITRYGFLILQIVANSCSRLAPIYDVYTSTGRIVSCLPNVQAVPNDIQIDYAQVHVPRKASIMGFSREKLLDQATFSSGISMWPEAIRELLTDLPRESVVRNKVF